MSRIVPCLWYAEKAHEAALFYVSLLPNSHIDSVTTLPTDSPSGPAGSLQLVEFTLGASRTGRWPPARSTRSTKPSRSA